MTSKIKKLSQGYGYKYADLSAIHEELEKQGITYYQYIEYNPEANADYVYTVLNYGEDEGKPLRGCRVISGGDSMKSAAQAQGSALTYARRYSLLMALGWCTEDDDGATAGQAKEQPVEKKGVDFNEVRKHVQTINSLDELTEYWQSLNLTTGQAKILQKYFSERKAVLEDVAKEYA